MHLIARLALLAAATASVAVVGSNIARLPKESSVPKAESAAFCPIVVESHTTQAVSAIPSASEAPFEAAWNPQTDLHVSSNPFPADFLVDGGDVDVALIHEPLTASQLENLYQWQIAQNAWVVVRNKWHGPRIDTSDWVRADDFANFLRSADGWAVIANEGFQPIPVMWPPPVPDWDINNDGTTSLGDLGAVSARWGQRSDCRRWIRADANNSGNVSLADIGVVTNKWGGAGFGAGPYDRASDLHPWINGGAHTYHGRAVASASHPLATIAAYSRGEERCNGSNQVDWEIDRDPGSIQAVSAYGGGGFNTDFWDCQLTNHILLWTLSAHWETGQAPTADDSDVRFCDLNEAYDCIPFYE